MAGASAADVPRARHGGRALAAVETMKIKPQNKDAKTKTADVAHSAGKKVEDVAETIGEKLKETADVVRDKLKDAGVVVKDAGSHIKHKLER
jgi:cysteinyl-tRNA synthetase